MRYLPLWSLSIALLSCGRPHQTKPDVVTAGAAVRRALHAWKPVEPLGDTRLLPIPIAEAPDRSGRYIVRRAGATTFFTPEGFAFAVDDGRERRAVHCTIEGGRRSLTGEGPEAARVHQFVGPQGAWARDLSTVSRVAWDDVYPGIDMVSDVARGGVAYRFVLSPGARVEDIVMRWQGGVPRKVEGGVDIVTDLGVLRVRGLHAFAIEGDRRVELTARHVVRGADVTLEVDGWDGTKPLIVDPTISWSSYLGGSGWDSNARVAVDGSGNVLVVGRAGSADFPTMSGFDTTYAAGDAFVTKISSAGALLWSTYLGGAGLDNGDAVVADAAGNVFVGGTTSSADFPTTGGFDTSRGGASDAFVAKLSSAGALTWSSYLGGSLSESSYPISMAIDATGDVYVGGGTESTDFPTTAGVDTSFGGKTDAFITKVTSAGAVAWSTYLGGTSFEQVEGIAIDGSGNVLLTGNTTSADFPTTGGFDTTTSSGDAFVTKLSPSGGVVWSSFLGGTGVDYGHAIAVDSAGNAFVVGHTGSGAFPTTGGFDTTSAGISEGFVAKVSAAGALQWSSYLGGGEGDIALGALTDSGGNVIVVGTTSSLDFPTLGAFDSTLGGSGDVFVTKISGAGVILWSSYLGGSGGESGLGPVGIASDAAGNLFVSGATNSADFPATGGFDTTLSAGAADVFITKLAPATLALGASCTSAGACISAHCVEGVCCDKPCAGVCESCIAAKKGSGTDGTCGNVAEGTDPRDKCAADPTPLSCDADGMCDGAGACRIYAKKGTACGATTCTAGSVAGKTCNGGGTCETATTSCAPYACGTDACKTVCAADTDCTADAYCTAAKTCAVKLAAGNSCADARECASGFCVDGVCCASTCAGQCEACNEPGAAGTCTGVTGKPRGTRAGCDALAETDCSRTTCDGTVRDKCAGFANGTAVSCGASACTADKKYQKAGTCDGAGKCARPEPLPCIPYVCDVTAATGCKSTCATNGDCAEGYTCTGSACVQGATCNAEGTASVDKLGKETPCAPFRCGTDGKCSAVCQTSNDCAGGFVCDPTSTRCVPGDAGGSGGDGGCGLGRAAGRGSPMALLALLALIARRRR